MIDNRLRINFWPSKTPDDAKQSILKTKWKIIKTQKLISLVEGKKSKNIYSLSEDQVVAILELRLQKLTALGINEIVYCVLIWNNRLC